MTATVVHGDCIEQMRAMDDACVDSIVTDPPYLISFMGREWDSADGIASKPDVWREALRVLRPGGHLLSFGGARTYHRMVCAIEDAGFEIRDQIMWLYGSGFPKSLDVSKQLDKMAGAEREVIGQNTNHRSLKVTDVYCGQPHSGDGAITAPATPEAQRWAGFGTALKPAHEPVVVARKPLIGTVAQNVLTHRCGAININGSRVDGKRWPANCIHDGSPEVLDAFAAFGVKSSHDAKGAGSATPRNIGSSTDIHGTRSTVSHGGDAGTAARFFYAAKASRAERQGSSHPTVKPLSLMRYLCKLVCPPGGTVLDMFCGTGTTLLAAQLEGFHAVGIEQDAAYVADARRRLGLTFELEAAD